MTVGSARVQNEVLEQESSKDYKQRQREILMNKYNKMSYILELVHTSAFKLGVQPLDTHRNKISRKNKKVKKKKKFRYKLPLNNK